MAVMPARLAPLVAVAALCWGCGHAGSAPTDGGAESPDDRRATDLPLEPLINPFCASPAACNDDPTLQTIAGVCDPTFAAGSCACNAGFSPNPRTGRCRAGTACAASAADPWDFRMPLDTADCASRATTACADGGTPRDVLATLMTSTCQLPLELTLRVELVDGCPTLFEAGAAPTATFSAEAFQPFLTCFTAILEHARLACSTGTDCLLETEFPVLPP
jgi:hypothetical protein